MKYLGGNPATTRRPSSPSSRKLSRVEVAFINLRSAANETTQLHDTLSGARAVRYTTVRIDIGLHTPGMFRSCLVYLGIDRRRLTLGSRWAHVGTKLNVLHPSVPESLPNARGKAGYHTPPRLALSIVMDTGSFKDLILSYTSSKSSKRHIVALGLKVLYVIG